MICHDDRMSAQPDSPTAATFYDAIGGAETFTALVHRFLRGGSHRTRAAPDVSPEDTTLAGSGRGSGLRMFHRRQYWGGPRTNRAARAPRLRLRHVPYRRDPAGPRPVGCTTCGVALDELELPAAAGQAVLGLLLPRRTAWSTRSRKAVSPAPYDVTGGDRAERGRGGGADAVITRSTCAASPTPTATAKETWPRVPVPGWGTGAPRCRRGVAHAVLPVADGRWRLRRRRLP